ncbi:MAG TPA: hypothetical protein EYQ41_02930 [Micavibrio sp.]|nr:hypothetical protein [Micavibrio sp.]
MACDGHGTRGSSQLGYPRRSGQKADWRERAAGPLGLGHSSRRGGGGVPEEQHPRTLLRLLLFQMPLARPRTASEQALQ